jgi:mannose-6-phosphate isomerase-like protein (cupin superfamily)
MTGLPQADVSSRSGVGYHEQQEDEIYYVLSGKGE